MVTSGLLVAGAPPRYVIGTVNASEFLITLSVSVTFLASLVFGHWQATGIYPARLGDRRIDRGRPLCSTYGRMDGESRSGESAALCCRYSHRLSIAISGGTGGCAGLGRRCALCDNQDECRKLSETQPWRHDRNGMGNGARCSFQRSRRTAENPHLCASSFDRYAE